MENSFVIIDAKRESYGVHDIENTMTVSELIGLLEEFDGDSRVILSHDNGYTYGAIRPSRVKEYMEDNSEY